MERPPSAGPTCHAQQRKTSYRCPYPAPRRRSSGSGSRSRRDRKLRRRVSSRIKERWVGTKRTAWRASLRRKHRTTERDRVVKCIQQVQRECGGGTLPPAHCSGGERRSGNREIGANHIQQDADIVVALIRENYIR